MPMHCCTLHLQRGRRVTREKILFFQGEAGETSAEVLSLSKK